MSSTNENELKKEKKTNIRWMLAVYDVLIFAIVSIILLVLYGAWTNYHRQGYFSRYACLLYVFSEDALLEKSTVRFGDMVESNVMSDCSLQM